MLVLVVVLPIRGERGHTYALRRLRLSYSNEIVIQIEHALSGERLVLSTRGNGVLC